jgi:hypothetical protein
VLSELMSGLSDAICNSAKGASLDVFLDKAEGADASALQGSSRTKRFERCEDDHQREEVERAIFLSSLMG